MVEKQECTEGIHYHWPQMKISEAVLTPSWLNNKASRDQNMSDKRCCSKFAESVCDVRHTVIPALEEYWLVYCQDVA